MITLLLEPKTSNIAPKFEEFFKDSSINKLKLINQLSQANRDTKRSTKSD
jgi:hypothetical protein